VQLLQQLPIPSCLHCHLFSALEEALLHCQTHKVLGKPWIWLQELETKLETGAEIVVEIAVRLATPDVVMAVGTKRETRIYLWGAMRCQLGLLSGFCHVPVCKQHH
jgi:hypothetical protein